MPPSPKTPRALDYMGHDQQQMIQVIHYCILDICFHSFDFTLLRSWNCPTDCTTVEYVFMAEVYHLFKGNLGLIIDANPYHEKLMFEKLTTVQRALQKTEMPGLKMVLGFP